MMLLYLNAPPPPPDTCSNDRGETLGISGKAQLATEPSSVNEPGTSLLWANLHIMEKYLQVLFLIFFNFHLPFFLSRSENYPPWEKKKK